MKITRHHYPSIPSTQEWAKENQHTLRPEEWHLYTTDEQTQGRGTHNRSWVSPPRVNLYATFSFLVPEKQSKVLFHVPQMTTYSVVNSLHAKGFNPKIKWVNDVLINKKKVCGVLCETSNATQHSGHIAVFIGIGINVNMSRELCDEITRPTTSLMIENNGNCLDKEEMLSLIQNELHQNIHLLLMKGFSPFYGQIAERMEYVNEKVTVEAGPLKYEGTFKGIDEHGRLILELLDGETKTFSDGRLVVVEVGILMNGSPPSRG